MGRTTSALKRRASSRASTTSWRTEEGRSLTAASAADQSATDSRRRSASAVRLRSLMEGKNASSGWGMTTGSKQELTGAAYYLDQLAHSKRLVATQHIHSGLPAPRINRARWP